MKRCPKCNRTYSTDTQKFCTHDGGLLFVIEDDLDKTVQFDSSKVRDAVQKPTTRDLGAQTPHFDPEATVVSQRPSPPAATEHPRARDTGSLTPQPTQHAISMPSAATTSTGPMAPPPSEPPVSAPPPPAQASAPLPPTQVVSGPIAPPAQTPVSGPIAPPPAVAAAQPSQPLPQSSAAAPAKKRSKLPLILGLLVVLFVLGVGVIAAAYFVVVRPRLAARTPETPVVTAPAQPEPGIPTTNSTPAEPSKPSNEPPPYNPPADAVQYVNSRDQLSGKLADNFVAFNFYYPNRWVKVPSTENFVTVERRLPPDFTQERLGVAPWYAPSDTTTFDDAFFQTLVAKDDANFAKNYPEYHKVSEGPVKIGSYDGYELRFDSTSRGTDKGDLTIWGREIFFPPRDGERTGVKLLILTTSLAPELKSMDDVGVKGELPMLLESFRFGK
jgi:hypothetical protein